MVDGKVQSALGHGVRAQLVSKLPQHRAAERQVTQVILEGGEARDDLAPDAKGGNAVGDTLLSFRDDLENRVAQRLEGSALRFLDGAQVVVDLRSGHSRTV